MSKFLKYKVLEIGGMEFLDASCACNECRAGQRGELKRAYGQGHFACGVCPDDLLKAEKRGLVAAMYHNNTWRWYVC